MMEKYTQQDMQNIFYEMDRKAYDFMQFQRDYYADKADDTMLMTRTTQPFWQSLRLSKRRLASKGLSMDVEISHDSKSKTIRDEGLQMRKDGYNLAGNKALNVKVQRRFYKNGKKISAIKNREICNLSLLKAEVNGDQAACPNCGYVSTISSFIDGCDACDSKFTVQDFETKVSAFSLEENTSAKIKDTVFANAKFLGKIIGAFVLLAIIILILSAMRLFVGMTEIDMAGPIVGLYLSFTMIPVIFKVLVILLIVFTAGTSYLMSIYKNPILQETVIKKSLPDISVRDFYQNLEYKLRNIHLTDKVDEVSVFARCSLDDVVKDYHNVVECDMTRLKFLQFKEDSDGYRVNVESELCLTECKGKRISTNYEKVNLSLFGRPEVINRSVTTLREYKCPGCGSSVNVLEGGRCSSCGNVFDYSEFGWVIESYQSRRRPISMYQTIKFAMIAVFAAVFSLNILFPTGIGKENIFQIYNIFSEQAAQLEGIVTGVQYPNKLYEGVTLLSSEDYLLERRFEYETVDADTIMKQYRSYLDGQGYVFYKETANSYIMYQSFLLDGSKEPEQNYYRITVTEEGTHIIVQGDLVSDLEEE